MPLFLLFFQNLIYENKIKIEELYFTCYKLHSEIFDYELSVSEKPLSQYGFIGKELASFFFGPYPFNSPCPQTHAHNTMYNAYCLPRAEIYFARKSAQYSTTESLAYFSKSTLPM